MNLFSEIEGRSGEDLTSAVLRFLILRSQEVRETFRELVSKKSKQGPIVMQEEFSCRLEVGMKSTANGPVPIQDNGSGRIDLLIQTDNAIIGIENKLGANFQPGQPEKYREGLEQLAQSFSSNGRPKQYVLVILAPRDRDAEIKEMINSYKHHAHYIQLDWETLLESLGKSCAKNSDRISQTLIDQLENYIINNRRTFWPKELAPEHLSGTFNPQGVQGEFVRKLTSIFPPLKGSRIGTGRTTATGYHLDVPPPEKAWLGFANKDILSGNVKHDSELILATTKSPTLQPPPPSFRSITMKIPWWDGPMHIWAIDYDDSENWKKPDTWRNLLKFLL
jgi:hypothetical protein